MFFYINLQLNVTRIRLNGGWAVKQGKSDWTVDKSAADPKVWISQSSPKGERKTSEDESGRKLIHFLLKTVINYLAGGFHAKLNPPIFDVSLLVGLDDDPADSDHRLHFSHLSGVSRVRFLLAIRPREQLRPSLHRHDCQHRHGCHLRH